MAVSQSPSKGSRLISRLLPVAIKFWLQTQLDEMGELTFELQATDRQILSGQIPGIALAAQGAIYRGVRLTDVTVHASDIEINIGQVLRGKSLQLKHAFPVAGNVMLAVDDLVASSTASVLAEGLLDFWQTLLAQADVAAEVTTHYGADVPALKGPSLSQYQSKLDIVDADLVLYLMALGQQTMPTIRLRGGLGIDQGHRLQLTEARWCLPSGDQVCSDALQDFCWDLGEQTELRSLTIQNKQLTCQCKVMVHP